MSGNSGEDRRERLKFPASSGGPPLASRGRQVTRWAAFMKRDRRGRRLSPARPPTLSGSVQRAPTPRPGPVQAPPTPPSGQPGGRPGGRWPRRGVGQAPPQEQEQQQLPGPHVWEQAVGRRGTSTARVDAESGVVVPAWGDPCRQTALTWEGAPPSSHGAGFPPGPRAVATSLLMLCPRVRHKEPASRVCGVNR